MNINPMSGRRAATGLLGLTTLLGGSLFLMHISAVSGAPRDMVPMGKITPWQAMKIATAGTPGKPIKATFEYEDHKWLYGVIIVSGKTIHEVEIDATTGKVGDSEVITPEGEGKETMQELNAAIGKKSASHAGKEAGEKGEKE